MFLHCLVSDELPPVFNVDNFDNVIVLFVIGIPSVVEERALEQTIGARPVATVMAVGVRAWEDREAQPAEVAATFHARHLVAAVKFLSGDGWRKSKRNSQSRNNYIKLLLLLSLYLGPRCIKVTIKCKSECPQHPYGSVAQNCFSTNQNQAFRTNMYMYVWFFWLAFVFCFFVFYKMFMPPIRKSAGGIILTFMHWGLGWERKYINYLD